MTSTIKRIYVDTSVVGAIADDEMKRQQTQPFWDQYPAVPGFDCVKMKREIQAEILEETKDMTDEEMRTFFCDESEAFRKEQTFCNQSAKFLHSIDIGI